LAAARRVRVLQGAMFRVRTTWLAHAHLQATLSEVREQDRDTRTTDDIDNHANEMKPIKLRKRLLINSCNHARVFVSIHRSCKIDSIKRAGLGRGPKN